MTLDNYTDENDAVQGDSRDDSPVIKALRKQVADLEKQVKAAPSRDSIEAEIRAGLVREDAISKELIALGQPAQMAAFWNGELGDAEVTRENVAKALTSRGYQVADADAVQEGEGLSPQNQADIANVSRLSAEVRATATPDHSDLATKIAQTTDRSQIAALMAEANLLHES